MHRIVYFECGKYKYRIGENGVKEIRVAKDPSFLGIIEYDDGSVITVIPTETVIVREEEQHIVVPDITLEKAS